MTRGKVFSGLLRLFPAVFLLVVLMGCGDEAETIPPLLTLDSGILEESTTEDTKVLSGDVESGAEVEVEVEVSASAKVQDLAVDGTRWRATIIDLSEGSNVVSVIATDDRGNNRILTFDIVRDSVSP